MDAWIQQQKGEKYDRDGQWASTGTINEALLTRLLTHPYLQKTHPKSTGREEFNINWLQQQLSPEDSAADVQATLLEFSARSICHEIDRLPERVNEVYICGGGAYNTLLMQRLETLIHPRLLANTATLGIPAQWIEGAAFAWLAQQTLAQQAVSLTDITLSLIHI